MLNERHTKNETRNGGTDEVCLDLYSGTASAETGAASETVATGRSGSESDSPLPTATVSEATAGSELGDERPATTRAAVGTSS